MNQQKILQAGKIASEVKKWIKPHIKKGVPLLEIAEKIESKIFELGGEPAFPVNLSVNEIAAHFTPSHDDKTTAYGLLKIDFGVHVSGWTSDTAFSLDLENSEENKKLIKASEEALEEAIKTAKEKIPLNEIGKAIQKKIELYGFSPVINLSGHSMERYNLHAGITIPNNDNSKTTSLPPGLYAIEPFATTGEGKVHDGKPSGIYQLVSERNIRNLSAREILKFIQEEYQTLPFCSRWIVKKFGTKSLIALKQLEDNENIHQFPQLVENSQAKVSQAEDTIFLDRKNKIITTA
ncbi:MAG: type II methionyl aminopeptidase [archaeon]